MVVVVVDEKEEEEQEEVPPLSPLRSSLRNSVPHRVKSQSR